MPVDVFSIIVWLPVHGLDYGLDLTVPVSSMISSVCHLSITSPWAFRCPIHLSAPLELCAWQKNNTKFSIPSTVLVLCVRQKVARALWTMWCRNGVRLTNITSYHARHVLVGVLILSFHAFKANLDRNSTSLQISLLSFHNSKDPRRLMVSSWMASAFE